MAELTPKEAANLARKVYDVKTELTWNAMLNQIASDPSLAGFNQNPSKGIGKSGWGQTSGFAYMAHGCGTHSGERLVAIRGTASLADGLTDVRCSFTYSPSGYVVHRGFALAFESIKPDIDKFFKQAGSQSSQVHVVGHSLGGAIACLTAEYLSLLGNNVTLYTFGCPRVGNGAYASAMDKLLGTHNIHRVYHEADPVSMIPLYPFVPVSNSCLGHKLPWKGIMGSPHAHFMDNYIATLADCSWRSLPTVQNHDFFASMEAWLEQAGKDGGTVKMYSCASLNQIFKALKWVLESMHNLGAAMAQFAFSGGIILIDVLAYLLYQGSLLGVTIAGYVKAILKAILKFLGRAVDSIQNVTVAFIKYVLDMFFRLLASAASRAINLIA
ncbi:lipase class 3 [Methylocaldum marinum]|uniref:Lipase class 3 n=1 Tax=Methylocaldum marinum TaxID=1432792 RepID=A0A250KTN6_9GAMM|nr:lipase family protein [Methylocaldum marinum]BBA34932.1 lipase class 3 [Methylocaldum marinum]